MKLADRVALITGAGSGIGRGCALLFAKEGARIAVADIDEQSAAETVRQIRGQGGEAIAIAADVSSPDDAQAMARALTRLAMAPGLRAAMGAAARETAIARFGLEEMARRTLELYLVSLDIARKATGKG